MKVLPENLSKKEDKLAFWQLQRDALTELFERRLRVMKESFWNGNYEDAQGMVDSLDAVIAAAKIVEAQIQANI